ncbi:hypothetical protein ACK8GG_16210 [Micromonosporaceae bacterium DT55]|uniref:hypothetical protein n=1 Tax=Melissospora conviva TaxID=3388432 RepID=UPI003C1E5975
MTESQRRRPPSGIVVGSMIAISLGRAHPRPSMKASTRPTGWTIRERDGGRVYESPMDLAGEQRWSGVAHVGRLPVPGSDRLFLVVAGVHALGSAGAVDYLARNLSDLYAQVGTRPFSMVVISDHDGETVTRSELLCPPRVHQ